jgi:hypothetical protein
MEKPLNTLVYKRTHKGDPCECGIFGIDDCMGQVRNWTFDAVIGVGGKSPWSRDAGIARKVNWIGICPSKSEAPSPRESLVTFDRFLLLNEKGPELKKLAPRFFSYMFEEKHVRLVKSRSLPAKMQQEVEDILQWADNHPETHPSKFICGCGKRSPTKRKC